MPALGKSIVPLSSHPSDAETFMRTLAPPVPPGFLSLSLYVYTCAERRFLDSPSYQVIVVASLGGSLHGGLVRRKTRSSGTPTLNTATDKTRLFGSFCCEKREKRYVGDSHHTRTDGCLGCTYRQSTSSATLLFSFSSSSLLPLWERSTYSTYYLLLSE